LCHSVLGNQNDIRHDSNMGAQSGVLMAITSYGPTALAGGMSHHQSGGNSTPCHYYTQ
ncbi:hypothetical protein AVEN_241824-1, partial [Araneus ventricosus]